MNPNKKPATGENTIEIRPHNMKQLMALYDISYKTLKRWLKPFDAELGKRNGYYYSIPQVRKIFSLLGFPATLSVED